MIASICTNPDLLKVLMILNNFLTVAKVCIPLIIIGRTTFDIMKLVMNGDQPSFKESMTKLLNSAIAGAIVFFIPTVIDVAFGFVDTGVSTVSCFTDATQHQVQLAYLRQSELLVTQAEATLERLDYNSAYTTVMQLEPGETRENYLERLESVDLTIKAKQNAVTHVRAKSKSSSSSEKLEVVGSFYSTGNGTARAGQVLTSEPDPSAAINYWKGTLNVKDYVFPKDEKTGLSLGAWPKDYQDIPASLDNAKTYANGKFVFPTTPTGGLYGFVYTHNGIDIMTTFATPVYSPVDGTIDYSEWGHTVNKGSDETAYSVTITMDEPAVINGKAVDTIFLTHMTGIRYRCTWGCNKKVSKGELIGFTGNASGDASSPGWAPHLHMSIYPGSNYYAGLYTEEIQSIYNIPSGSTYKIEAGG